MKRSSFDLKKDFLWLFSTTSFSIFLRRTTFLEFVFLNENNINQILEFGKFSRILLKIVLYKREEY